MIRHLALLTAWLSGVGVAVGALFWLLVNTPDANALMLAVSAASLVAMFVTAAVGVNTAVLVGDGAPFSLATIGRAVTHTPRFALALAVGAAVWALVGRLDLWVAASSGEIAAWFIARLGVSDAEWLLTLLRWLGSWARFALAPVLVVALVGGGGVRRRLSGRTVPLVTGAWLALIVLPWRYATWTPDWQAGTWMEPVLAAARLGIIFVLSASAAAVMVLAAARPSPAPMTDAEGRPG
ncbi:MAG: hypothetical protein AB1635_16525 [Acidobacteriota bacterium]